MKKIQKQQGNYLLMLVLVGIIFFGACKSKQTKAPEVSTNSQTSSDTTASEPENEEKVILFFGNSLTAGYGLEDQQSFPSLIQQRIDSLKLNFTVVNAGLSGETTAGGNGRIDWVLKQPVHIFILELGGNDVLRGLALDQTNKNLRAIIDKVRSRHPDIPIIIAGMQAPPNMGEEYTAEFAKIFPDIAKDYNAGLIPFLLEDVAADPDPEPPGWNSSECRRTEDSQGECLEGIVRLSMMLLISLSLPNYNYNL